MSARFRFGIKALAAAMGWMMAAQPAMTEVQPPMPTRLILVIVRGDGGVNEARQQPASEPVVRVEDENHRPLAGAVVAFTLPSEGASGEFGNHSKTLTVVTGEDGEAAIKELHPNQVAGKVPVYINVSYRGLMAQGSMMRFNLAGHTGKGHGKLALVLLLVAGAAAAGAVIALRSKSSTSPSTAAVPAAIGLTPGTGTVSLP